MIMNSCVFFAKNGKYPGELTAIYKNNLRCEIGALVKILEEKPGSKSSDTVPL
jgi:hypothetical protein